MKEDIYTSIHIDEFNINARDTKLGPEEITRDIPNVGEEALSNLGPDGVDPDWSRSKVPEIFSLEKLRRKAKRNWLPRSDSLRAIFGEKGS